MAGICEAVTRHAFEARAPRKARRITRTRKRHAASIVSQQRLDQRALELAWEAEWDAEWIMIVGVAVFGKNLTTEMVWDILQRDMIMSCMTFYHEMRITHLLAKQRLHCDKLDRDELRWCNPQESEEQAGEDSAETGFSDPKSQDAATSKLRLKYLLLLH